MSECVGGVGWGVGSFWLETYMKRPVMLILPNLSQNQPDLGFNMIFLSTLSETPVSVSYYVYLCNPLENSINFTLLRYYIIDLSLINLILEMLGVASLESQLGVGQTDGELLLSEVESASVGEGEGHVLPLLVPGVGRGGQQRVIVALEGRVVILGGEGGVAGIPQLFTHARVLLTPASVSALPDCLKYWPMSLVFVDKFHSFLWCF